MQITSFDEYYDNLEVDFKLESDETKHTGLIPEECFMPAEDETSEATNFVKDNLEKMIRLKEFQYRSRFASETDYKFLVTKPASLTKLDIDHINGLDLKFLDGIEYLGLDTIDFKFIDVHRELPASLKTVTFNYCDDEEEFS